MTEERRSFSEQLLNCETPTPAYRQKYEKEVQDMFEKRLSTGGRAMWGFWTVFCLAQAIFFIVIGITSYGDLPVWGTATFGGGVVFALAFAAICAQIAATGTLKLKVHHPAIAGLTWCFVVLIMTTMLVTAPDTIVGVKTIVSTLVFFIFGAVFLLLSKAEQAELRTKEKLLEIEYRIAELADRLPNGKAE